MSTRKMCVRSWEGAKQMAAASGAITLTAASFAGYAIETAGGDAELARQFAPEGPQLFRERVLAALDGIVAEEGKPLRAAGGAS